jgi:2-amino-4-hydroxy-6-hydroxymethyldihydropteridine diphosphokinase
VTGAAAGGPREDEPKPVVVYVSAGSNVDPAANLRRAIQALERRFGPLTSSSVYRSKAVGFDGDDFLNAVVGFQTRESAAQVAAALEQIHQAAGRVRGPDSFSPRTLDLDLLLYGQQVIDEPRLRIRVPHGDVMRYGFVLGPLAEIAPGLRHPVTGQTMAELWEAFDKNLHPLQRLDVPLT